MCQNQSQGRNPVAAVDPPAHLGHCLMQFYSPPCAVYPRLAHPVVPHAAFLVQLHVPGVSDPASCPTSCPRGPQTGNVSKCEHRSAPQGGVQDVQRGDGLPNGGHAHLELWCRGNDLHPLEGAPHAAADLPHPHQRPHGPSLYQVPARVVRLGHPGGHLHLW